MGATTTLRVTREAAMLWLAKQTLDGHSDAAIERIVNGILGQDGLREVVIRNDGADDAELSTI